MTDVSIPSPRGPKRRLFWLGLVLVLAGLLEISAWLGCRVLTAHGIFYQPQPRAKFAEHLGRRHPILGWPAAETFTPRRAPESERRADKPVLVSLYGEPFTFGSEVSDDETRAGEDARVLGHVAEWQTRWT